MIPSGSVYGRGRGRGYDGDYDDGYGYGRGRDRGCDCCEENKWWFREEERIRHYELDKSDELAATRAALAASQSERFAEQGDFKNYKALSRMIEEENEETQNEVKRLAAKVCDLEKFTAVSDAKADGKFEVIKESLKDFKEDLYGVKVGAREELKAAIALEAERRECGDRELQEWTNCNFVRNKKVLPIEEICPQAMPRFNAFDIDRIDDCGCRRERREERQERGKKSDKE